ncbi:unnamed protein product [Cuscuta campestris]|uniref:Uncharacterized protein n=1 Tax=Cuscuta campestris TaxID=132261 RepID=A0A484LKS9_9ASTE|nr:unnamed protein product [Cuscuta campestris]
MLRSIRQERLVMKLREAKNRREELDEELMDKDTSYRPPPLSNYNKHTFAQKLEWNKRTINWRFNKIAQPRENKAQLQREAEDFYEKQNEVRELDRLLAMHNIFVMTPAYDRYDELSPEFWRRHMDLHISLQSNKLKFIEEEEKSNLQAQEEMDQWRTLSHHQESQEVETNFEPILKDSPKPTPSQKPKCGIILQMLAGATVVMIPKYSPSHIVHEVEPAEGPDSEPPIQSPIEKERGGVIPMTINFPLLNCVKDTPLEGPVLEEIEPLTYPKEFEEESIDEKLLSIEGPILCIETFANDASSEELDQTFFDSLLDEYDYVCPKDSSNQISCDELLLSDTEDSFMGVSTVVIIRTELGIKLRE